MLVSKNPKICVTPSGNPLCGWNIGCVGSPGVGACVGDVHFMLFVSIPRNSLEYGLTLLEQVFRV